jgi:hypothetical protein
MELAVVRHIERMNNKVIPLFPYIKAEEPNKIILVLIDEELGF